MLLLESHSLLVMGPQQKKKKSSDGLYPDFRKYVGKPVELLKDVRKICKISAKKKSRVGWGK